MASSKEMQHTSRPLIQRSSMSSNSASGGLSAGRLSHSRNNSHSVLSSSLNATHRVSRRKSVTNTAANIAAVAAALQEAGDKAVPQSIGSGSRRNTMSKSGVSRSVIAASLPNPPASLAIHKFIGTDVASAVQDSAIEDELIDMSADEGEANEQTARARRASDGQPLVKEGRKSNRPDLRCDKCGKGYKHSSCLTKHLWEHTPEWAYTSKLLISKHQQVQLLEAASVLVAMNTNAMAMTPPDSARDFNSDQDSSASPTASGYSDLHDRSSADTTPPPQSDAINVSNASYRSMAKRYSSASGFARSYQSGPSNGSIAGSVPTTSGFGHFRQLSQEQRPTSSGKNATGQEDHELAAAVELLSCSLNSNGGSRLVLIDDAPPVPPLPAQYLEDAALAGSFITSFPKGAPESFTRGTRVELTRELTREDVKMEESAESAMDEDDDDLRSRARSDEDDDGVFGRMEE